MSVSLVRLLIPDNDEDPNFTDEEINDVLTLEGGSTKLATARCLEIIASSLSMLGKYSSLDVTTDPVAGVAKLMERASLLREEVQDELDSSDIGSHFGVVSTTESA